MYKAMCWHITLTNVHFCDVEIVQFFPSNNPSLKEIQQNDLVV